jgi:hypothetical protein
MLQLSLKDAKNFYIGMYDWGLANRVIAKTPSLYDYKTKAWMGAI